MNAALAALNQLARRWPYSVTCVLLTVIFAGLDFYLWQFEVPGKRVIARARTEEMRKMEMKSQKEQKLQQELVRVREATRRIEDNLVDETNLADNMRFFYRLEEQTKAQLPELNQVSSPVADKFPLFRRVAYGLRVVGTYDQVAAFLLALENGDRLVKISTFNFVRADPGGQAVALDLNIEVLGKK